MTILVSHQAVPPTFYNKIAPMELLRKLKNSFFLHRSFQEFDNVSAGKKENLKFAGLLYITKNWKFSCVHFAHFQFLCSLTRFDFASRGVRQHVQLHTLYARLLVFDKTSAQPHFAGVNCSDAVTNMFYIPVFTRSLIFFAIMSCCVVALILLSSDIPTWSAGSLYSVQWHKIRIVGVE